MKVLVVDDDPDILGVVSLCLTIRWPEAVVVTASDGASGLERFRSEGADLVVLDLGLPDMDVMDLCRTLREQSAVPVIMLTVLDQQQDIVRGLETGADDYITKPFDQMELLARVRAVLRRGEITSGAHHRETFYDGNGGTLDVDFTAREVTLDGEPVRLTPTEYRLLFCLAGNAGAPVAHRDLLTEVWGPEYADATEYLKVHIQHLRRKLNDDPAAPRLITTERGFGYKFVGRSPRAGAG